MNIAGIKNLSQLIGSAQKRYPERTSLNKLFKVCFQISYTYLCYKVKNGHLKLSSFNLTLKDLALDCIGELFGLDEEGFLFNFRNAGLIDENKNGEEDDLIFVKLKTLVIGKVNDHLFKLYRESDSDLGKLIRNIKLNVIKINDLELVRKNGSLTILSRKFLHVEDHKPQFPREVFYSELLPRIRGKTSLKAILQEIPFVLSVQKLYVNYFPLTSTALVIRQIFVEENMLDEIPGVELPSTEERDNLICEAINNIKNLCGNKYVAANKITADTLEKYFNAIREILVDSYIQYNLQDNSYYDILINFITLSDKEDYMNNHRTRFEYLVSLVRNEFIELIKMEI